MSLKMMMVYSDKHSAEVGEQVAENLKRSLGNTFELAQCRWNSELLRSPKLCAMAAAEARESDIVIISTAEARELPKELAVWISKWKQKRHAGPAALVALLNKNPMPTVPSSLLERHLQRVAQQAHMDFFCHHEEQEAAAPKVTKKKPAREQRVTYQDPSGKFEISIIPASALRKR